LVFGVWGLKGFGILGFWGFAIRIESFGVLRVFGFWEFWGFGFVWGLA